MFWQFFVTIAISALLHFSYFFRIKDFRNGVKLSNICEFGFEGRYVMDLLHLETRKTFCIFVILADKFGSILESNLNC